MVEPCEWYAAMAFDLRDAGKNGADAAEMLKVFGGMYFTKQAREYAEKHGAPWPPAAAWCQEKMADGGMP